MSVVIFILLNNTFSVLTCKSLHSDTYNLFKPKIIIFQQRMKLVRRDVEEEDDFLYDTIALGEGILDDGTGGGVITKTTTD